MNLNTQFCTANIYLFNLYELYKQKYMKKNKQEENEKRSKNKIAWGIFESSLTTLNNSQCLPLFTGYLLAQHTLQLLVLNKFRLWRCTKSLISTSIQYILAADDDCSVLVKCSCRRRGSTSEEPQKKNNK